MTQLFSALSPLGECCTNTWVWRQSPLVEDESSVDQFLWDNFKELISHGTFSSFCSNTLLSSCFLPGVRRTWMNVSQAHACPAASAWITWTVLSACVIWITQGYTAKWMSVTFTCTSSWARGRTCSSWCPSLCGDLTMSQKLSGSSSTMSPHQWRPAHRGARGAAPPSSHIKKIYIYI